MSLVTLDQHISSLKLSFHQQELNMNLLSFTITYVMLFVRQCELLPVIQ